MLPTRVSSEGWYHLLQKLTGRSVTPGLQMFGQSISGNVDMDGNGYTGPVRAKMEILLLVSLSWVLLLQQWCNTLVMEAFCLQHSRVDTQTLVASWLKTSLLSSTSVLFLPADAAGLFHLLCDVCFGFRCHCRGFHGR